LLKEENLELKKMIEELNTKIMSSGGKLTEEDKTNFLEMKEIFEANNKAIMDNGKN
jgi:hypothetical protein